MHNARWLKSVLAAGFAVFLSFSLGCSQSNELGTVPVSGKVTYQGKPVEGATVSFLAEGDARPATGISGADGVYKLMTLNYEGAMPGNYTVLVEKIETPPELTKVVSMEEAAKTGNQPLPKPKKLLPSQYGDATKSPLKFEIQAGRTNTFDLKLAD